MSSEKKTEFMLFFRGNILIIFEFYLGSSLKKNDFDQYSINTSSLIIENTGPTYANRIFKLCDEDDNLVEKLSEAHSIKHKGTHKYRYSFYICICNSINFYIQDKSKVEKIKQFVELVKSYNLDSEEELSIFLNEEKFRDALDSTILKTNTSISFERIRIDD